MDWAETLSTTLFFCSTMYFRLSVHGLFWVCGLSVNDHKFLTINDEGWGLRLITTMKVTNKMQLYRLIYFPLSALHVSGDVFAHHQEH
jgi:hypothetical protein